MKYKAVIVEDELHSRNFLKNLITEYCPELNIVALAQNISEGINAIENFAPDLVFLDIEMQNGTGFDLLNHFAQPSFAVIFTTAYDHYAIQAIKFSAVDYLLKPIEIEELQEAVKKVTQKENANNTQQALQVLLKNLQQKQDQSIGLSTSEGLEFIELNDIIRIEASGPYSHFIIKNRKKIIVSKHLKEYEKMLTGHGFFRIHNSSIINLKEVKKYVKTDGGYVVLSDNEQVSVSVKKKDEFLEQIQQQRLL